MIKANFFKITKFLKQNWQISLVNLTIVVYFSRLFFPLSTFTTPDFGRTDILHSGLALKYMQSESLRSFKLPLWEDKLGGGYPLIPEALTFFFLPNFFLSFLPIKYVMPLFFLIVFTIAANSTYLLLRYLKHSRIASAFGSAAYTFSAAMMLRITHTGIIPAVALFPLAFLLTFKTAMSSNLKNLILLSIVLSQILVSFPQLYAYIMCLIAVFLVLYSKLVKKLKIFEVLKSLIFVASGSILLSSIYILPFYELLKRGTRLEATDIKVILSTFPMSWKDLLSFINPFINGNASNGSYNFLDWASHGVFWENTAYIGLIPFIFAIASIFLIFKKKQKTIYMPIIILLFLTILLALGKNSPLHIVFSFPPLSFFRVPSRFLLFSQLFMAILASYSLSALAGKFKKISVIIFTAALLELVIIWWNYHPTSTFEEVAKKPQILQEIDIDSENQYRFLTIDSSGYWNKVFEKNGWKNQEDNYKFFYNSIEPNMGIFYGINQFESYQIVHTRRQVLQQNAIKQNIESTEETKFNDLSKEALSFSSIKYIISTKPINDKDFDQLSELEKDDYKFFLYKYKYPKPIYSIYYKIKNISKVKDYSDMLNENENHSVAFIENFDKELDGEGNNSIDLLKRTPGKSLLKINTSKPGVFVFSDSYYPGWKAKIDGKFTKIYAANINSKAILVPTGNHKVEFYYLPIIQFAGILISILAYFACIKILLKRR